MKKDKKPSIRFKEFTEAWEQRKLGDISEIVGGGTPSTNIDEYWNGDINWYSPAEIGEQIIVNTSQRKITKLGLEKSSAKMLPKGTVLFTSRAGIGNTAILGDTACTNQGFQSIVPDKEQLDSYFIFSRSKELKDYGERVGAGSTFVEVSGKQMSEMELLIPDLDEQKTIGCFFERIDNLITLHQSKCNNIQVKNKINIRYNDITWEQRKLGEYGDFTYGHSAPKWSVTSDAKTPCVRYGELYTKFGVKIDKVFSYTNMPKNKLVFSKGNEVLIPRVGEDPYDYNHCTWLSMPNVAIGEMISIYYTKQNPLFTAIMYNATLRNEFAIRVEGGSVTNLYYDKLKDIDVSFPNKEEQEKISTFFYKIDNLITLHQHK